MNYNSKSNPTQEFNPPSHCPPFPSNLSKQHIPQRNLLALPATSNITPTPAPTRLPHKRILLLSASVSAISFNEQSVAVVRAQATRVFEQYVGFALGHFAQDDDVVWILAALLAVNGRG